MALAADARLGGQRRRLKSTLCKVKSVTFREDMQRPTVTKWQGQNFRRF